MPAKTKTSPPVPMIGELRSLPVADVWPDPDNVRGDIAVDDELVASIASVGILEPLLVGPFDDGHFSLIAGHRRLAAAIKAGLAEVPVIERADLVDPKQRLVVQLVENLMRKDLDPFEEAEGFRRLADTGSSQRDIASLVGCSQPHVARRMQLLELAEPTRQAVRDERLPVHLAVKLAGNPAAEKAAVGGVAGAGKIDEYSIERALDQAKRDAKTIEAREIGKASGLPEVKSGDSWKYTGVEQAKAKHWYVGPYDGEIHWLGAQSKEHSTTVTGKRVLTEEDKQVEERRERWAARTGERRAFIAGELAKPGRKADAFDLIERVADSLTVGGWEPEAELVLDLLDGGEPPEGVSEWDWALDRMAELRHERGAVPFLSACLLADGEAQVGGVWFYARLNEDSGRQQAAHWRWLTDHGYQLDDLETEAHQKALDALEATPDTGGIAATDEELDAEDEVDQFDEPEAAPATELPAEVEPSSEVVEGTLTATIPMSDVREHDIIHLDGLNVAVASAGPATGKTNKGKVRLMVAGKVRLFAPTDLVELISREAVA